jgi:rifampicin phosphotransferase
MEKYVLHFNEIDKSDLLYVGGKGANLGEMTKAGFPVPSGFCVTTNAYRDFIQTSMDMDELYRLLDQVSYDDLAQIQILGHKFREKLVSLLMPNEIKTSILEALEKEGEGKAYAVRSSATAEDLPTASFAGQQDTYLNVCGQEQILTAIQNCWASLFTDRAISYRAKNGFDHRSVFLSVIVQEMIFPEVSGIMFTADPITGHRQTISIDASFGLGEALVSGLVSADLYQLRSDEIIKKNISKKKLAIYALPKGGTITKNLPFETQEAQALPDDKILELARVGQKIENHYGSEQDIEWGFAQGNFYILQSRPITSLYPAPPVLDDKFHVFISFGHIQMMTDVVRPLAVSFFGRVTDFIRKDSASTGKSNIHTIGGRMYADVTAQLSVKPIRKRMLKVLSGMDELMASALVQVCEREQFPKTSKSKKKVLRTVMRVAPVLIPAASKVVNNFFIKDPSYANQYATALIEKIVKEQEKRVFSVSGADRIRMIQQRMGNMLPEVLSKVAIYALTGFLASKSLEKALKKRVGEERGAFLLSQLYKSLPGNVTTELGLTLGDLADTARKCPEVIHLLQEAKDNHFYEELNEVHGGIEFKHELDQFLQKYGMRCAGEIDITKPRWRENPVQLIPSILSNIQTGSCGEHRDKFRKGEIEAELAAKEILAQFRFLQKRRISRLVKLYRNLMGMREHHKFTLVKLLDIYKRAIMEEAQILVEKGIFQCVQDVFYFSLGELIELLEDRFRGNAQEFVEAREFEYESYRKLNPPRVMTSEGEIITGKLRDVKAPAGSLVGTPVSAGVVEGVARVIHRLEDAKLEAGEILVAPYTDPGWTPLFTSVVGLITEAGGMMTHGSVIAREYGIPAVVGIENATEIIKDGDFIRVDGTRGYVEILR